MSESSFLNAFEALIVDIENLVESLAVEMDAEIESARTGNVLTLEFEDRSKIIINSQTAMQEAWIAAKAGGFHYRHDGEAWRDTRVGTELLTMLTSLIQQQAE